MNVSGQQTGAGSWRYFAVISDVHANLPALRAVLARLRAQENTWETSIPLIVGGDVLDAGPHPAETLDLIERHASVRILGNHEEYLRDCVDKPTSERFRDPLWRFIPWTVARLGAARIRAFVTSCVPSAMSDDSRLLFLHASREANNRMPEFFGEQNRNRRRLPEQQTVVHRKLVFAGHNHYTGLYPEPGTGNLWVNTGSVGYPFVDSPTGLSVPLATFVLGRYHSVECGGTPCEFELHFQAVPYTARELIEGYVESGALLDCLPYSIAILAQSLFNDDINYPAFKRARAQGVSQAQLPAYYERQLDASGVTERVRGALRAHGYHELAAKI